MRLWAFDVPVLDNVPQMLPLNVETFVSHILPPIFSYIALANLVILSETHIRRAALCPIVAVLAFRAATHVDLSNGNPEHTIFNVYFALMMFCITIRTLEWALLKESPRRHLRPVGGASSIVLDALDLSGNMRGHGWNWSEGLRVPSDPRASSRVMFCLYVLLSTLVNGFLSGAILIAVQAFSPETLTVLSGGTIFDSHLSPWAQCLRSGIISTLGAFGIYCNMQMTYGVCTLVGVVIFQQDPVQWPPAFDAPWFATSLHNFWSSRWHQFFRQTFIVLGGRPLALMFGRVGYIFGSFLASGLLHYIFVLKLNGAVGIWYTVFPLTMMAAGIVLEHFFCQFTGRKVCGWLGWLWTMAWLLVWGSMLIDGVARAGMYGVSHHPLNNLSLVRDFIHHNVAVFDKWLHAFP